MNHNQKMNECVHQMLRKLSQQLLKYFILIHKCEPYGGAEVIGMKQCCELCTEFNSLGLFERAA